MTAHRSLSSRGAKWWQEMCCKAGTVSWGFTRAFTGKGHYMCKNTDLKIIASYK